MNKQYFYVGMIVLISTFALITPSNAGINAYIEHIFTMQGNTLTLDGLQGNNDSVFTIKNNGHEFSIYSGRLSDGTDGFSIGTKTNSTFRIFQNNKDILTVNRDGLFSTDALNINPVTVKPDCNALRRGNLVVQRGGLGEADKIFFCLKDPANKFMWREI